MKKGFAHFSGEGGGYFVAAGDFPPEHGAGKHGGDHAFHFHGLFLIILLLGCGTCGWTATAAVAATVAAAAVSTATAAIFARSHWFSFVSCQWATFVLSAIEFFDRFLSFVIV